jgi:hypothetical protein
VRLALVVDGDCCLVSWPNEKYRASSLITAMKLITEKRVKIRSPLRSSCRADCSQIQAFPCSCRGYSFLIFLICSVLLDILLWIIWLKWKWLVFICLNKL